MTLSPLSRYACIALLLLIVLPLSAATFTVTNTNDSGPGSLRHAMASANANSAEDTITFSIGSGPQTIQPLSNLPSIQDAVIIDARTQPGYAGTPQIELDGSLVGGSWSSVRGLSLTKPRRNVRVLSMPSR